MTSCYDNCPYESYPIAITAPATLYMHGRLRGHQPPPWREATVLELGCANGANLLPLAYHHPDAHFIGIDSSQRQINDAIEGVEQLGLENIRFLKCNIMEFELQEKFDYVIAHGVYSWVPEAVRLRILELAQTLLNPGGILYLSYNTLPGWGIRGLVRRIFFQLGISSATQENANKALALSQQLASLLPEGENAYSVLMRQELGRLHKFNPSYIAHEYLEPNNDAFQFSDVASLAKQYGLDYLGDGYDFLHEGSVQQSLFDTLHSSYPANAREDLIDFLCNRQMRASMFSKTDGKLQRQDSNLDIKPFFIAANLSPVKSDMDLNSQQETIFKGELDIEISATNPLVKAAFIALNKVWPYALTFEELVAESDSLLKENQLVPYDHRESDIEELIQSIQYLHWHAHLELRMKNMTLITCQKPVLAPLARYELNHRMVITTPLHDIAWITPIQKILVLMLTGDHTLQELLPLFKGRIAESEEFSSTSDEELNKIFEETLSTFFTWQLIEEQPST